MKRWYEPDLACPDCGADLAVTDLRPSCPCGFAPRPGPPPDFRPQQPRPRTMVFPVGTTADADLKAANIDNPPRLYSGPKALRDSSELFSAAMPHLKPGMRLLDLGCGPRDQFVPANHLGLEYAGIDYDSKEADLLADGHAIPFREATFDAVLSYAVLEHLYNPQLALREVARVLRPGGVFFGAVSQGEPFHHSFFHHTAFGVLAVFGQAGFRVDRIWPTYDTLHSLARMGRYPRAIRLLIEAVDRADRALPILSPRKYFRKSSREKQLDRLHRAASICFVALRGK